MVIKQKRKKEREIESYWSGGPLKFIGPLDFFVVPDRRTTANFEPWL